MELSDIKGIGPKNIKLLNKLGIKDIYDLITFFPFRYEILKKSNLNNIKIGDKVIVDGIVETTPTVCYFNRKMDRMTFKLSTGKQLLNILIYNRGYLKNNLPVGTKLTLVGKYDRNGITVSELIFGLLEEDKIIPIYHTTSGLHSKQLKKFINNALDCEVNINDNLPLEIISKYNFMDKKEAINIMHNPSELSLLNGAINRLKYEELFIFMSKINLLKHNSKNKIGIKRDINYQLVEKFINKLSFNLTDDQVKAVKDIFNDLISERRMNRLLQGDVGSGKTIVAIISMYINYLGGYQSALMAPTEILAKQHYDNIVNLVKDYNINVVLLTGKTKVKEKKEIYQKIESGKIDFIIGTHALFTADLKYKNLGLVITDEQHRFGVNQRGNLKNKGITPDILYMSATPIPRTYALTLYGDMDISSIKTIPNGRKEIITTLKKEKEIKDVLFLMYNELKKGHQIYVVAPLIEESEKSSLENIKELEIKMNKAFGKLYKIGILHGKMTDIEKDEVMKKFEANEINILISTTVIEVGIDIKNATMMVIFDAFRFGLSALHQLRGRVGRNSLQSYCILISDKETERLNILVNNRDGFKISEEDFLLRGSGDLFGINQSGDMTFKIANIKKDYKILLKAKEDSEKYILSNKDNIKIFDLDLS